MQICNNFVCFWVNKHSSARHLNDHILAICPSFEFLCSIFSIASHKFLLKAERIKSCLIFCRLEQNISTFSAFTTIWATFHGLCVTQKRGRTISTIASLNHNFHSIQKHNLSSLFCILAQYIVACICIHITTFCFYLHMCKYQKMDNLCTKAFAICNNTFQKAPFEDEFRSNILTEKTS